MTYMSSAHRQNKTDTLFNDLIDNSVAAVGI